MLDNLTENQQGSATIDSDYENNKEKISISISRKLLLNNDDMFLTESNTKKKQN